MSRKQRARKTSQTSIERRSKSLFGTLGVLFGLYLLLLENATSTSSEQEHLNYISKLLLAGEVEEAIRLGERAAEEQPDSPKIALYLADAYATHKNYTAALPAYERAYTLLKDPRSQSKALTWVGVCHRRLGNHTAAYKWLHRAVAEGTPGRENFFHLAVSYQNDGKYAEASKWWVKVLQTEAQTQDVRVLASNLAALGHWELVVQVLRSCLEGLCPEFDTYPEYLVHLHLSTALEQIAEETAAFAHLEKAIDLVGTTADEIRAERVSFLRSAEGWRQQAADLPSENQALHELFDDLSTACKPLFARQKPHPEWSIIQKQYVNRFRWPIPETLIQRAQDKLLEQRRTFLHDPTEVEEAVPPFTCLALPVFSLEDCIFSSRVDAFRIRQSIRKASTLPILGYDDFDRSEYPESTEPLHVGLFSADVRGHPMLTILSAFLKYSNGMTTIKVTLYHTNADPHFLERLSAYVDNTVTCTKTAYQDCIEHARRHKVQVWLEMTGSTGEGIPILSAAGPAPVGVLWAGFPGSMAMNGTLQYMVSDTYTVPPELADAYPEKMIYVPGSWMIADASVVEEIEADTDVIREQIRKEHRIPSDAVVYCYFGRTWKIDDKIFDAWARIIDNVPNSYLIMLHYVSDVNIEPQELQGSFRKQWETKGIPSDRLLILPPFQRGKHNQVLKKLCDVALDTAIYGGGTTSYDALYAGLPMVHVAGGRKMMQRSGGSILTSAGLEDLLIAESLDDYIRISIRLGADGRFYDLVKQKLHDARSGLNGKAVLFRPQVAVEALVVGLREAYRKWKAGERPSAIHSQALIEVSGFGHGENEEL